jgi:hypothetical protein
MSDALKSRASRKEIEAAMAAAPQVNLPLVHRFTPGLYVRECFIPAGTLLTTMVHLTEHPFTISAGTGRIFTEADGVSHYSAPFTGITQPGTSRLIYADTDTVWTTYHPTTETDLEKLVSTLVARPENPLIPPDFLPICQRPENLLP